MNTIAPFHCFPWLLTMIRTKIELYGALHQDIYIHTKHVKHETWDNNSNNLATETNTTSKWLIGPNRSHYRGSVNLCEAWMQQKYFLWPVSKVSFSVEKNWYTAWEMLMHIM